MSSTAPNLCAAYCPNAFRSATQDAIQYAPTGPVHVGELGSGTKQTVITGTGDVGVVGAGSTGVTPGSVHPPAHSEIVNAFACLGGAVSAMGNEQGE